MEDPDDSTSFPQTLLVDYIRVYDWGEDDVTADLEAFCVDVFHEPPCEQMFFIDDVTRHYWIYDNTYTHSTSTDAHEGAESVKITANGTGWWGGGIHSDTPMDMSSYTAMTVALKASNPNFNNVEIRMEAQGQSSAVSVNATDYGYTNDGTWYQLNIPLEDFVGLDLNNITGLFMMGGAAEVAGAELLVDAVAFE